MSRRLPDVRTMLAELVALPSVSSLDPAIDQGNRAVVERLAGWLDGLGFACTLQDIPGAPAKANLIARRGSGPGGLVLAGHSDTVPCNPEAWRSDPFALTERDGRLYGLGSSDMKSFFPIALDALGAAPLDRLTAPITVVATADEESSMSGARALVRAGEPLGRFAIIGEPTGLRPIHCHKGVVMLALRVHGRSGHSSNPALGRSALEGMHAVMGALLDWREGLQRRHRDPAFAVPVPTVNLGVIRGGDNPNRICAHCELQLDIRLLPGMQAASLVTELRALGTEALAGRELGFEVEPLSGAIPAFCCPRSAQLVQAAEALSGTEAGSVAFATEAPFLTELGLETVVLGAGDIDVAHQADEYLGLERIAPMNALLGALIGRFCLGEAA